jgi:hypothetical protein
MVEKKEEEGRVKKRLSEEASMDLYSLRSSEDAKAAKR